MDEVMTMLHQFTFKNFKSFKEETTLDMLASSIKEHPHDVVTDVMEEKVATQYESGQGSVNWHYLPASNEIIWYSGTDDDHHLPLCYVLCNLRAKRGPYASFYVNSVI